MLNKFCIIVKAYSILLQQRVAQNWQIQLQLWCQGSLALLQCFLNILSLSSTVSKGFISTVRCSIHHPTRRYQIQPSNPSHPPVAPRCYIRLWRVIGFHHLIWAPLLLSDPSGLQFFRDSSLESKGPCLSQEVLVCLERALCSLRGPCLSQEALVFLEYCLCMNPLFATLLQLRQFDLGCRWERVR